MDALERLLKRRSNARTAAHTILEDHEASASRVIEFSESFKRLRQLPVDVADYYREALRSLQTGCYRAAIVLAWSGFIYCITEKMVTGYHKELKSNYGKWKVGSADALLSDVPDAQILEAAKKVGLIDHQTLNIYKGWLSTRNQCAHPTLFEPGRNVALGITDGIISEVDVYL